MIFIPEMLVKVATDQPDKEALCLRDKRLTYKEFKELSDQTAALLISKGIVKGDRVGIFSSKCIDEIVVLLAIMKIGAVFVHINPYFKEEQLRHIVLDCEVKALFLHKSKEGTFQKADITDKIPMIFPLEIDKLTHGAPVVSIDTACQADMDDPAAILYTSGSTGRPKGIVVSHRIFYQSTVVSAELLHNNADDRIISLTPFSFDGSLSQLFTAIYTGGVLVLQDSLFPKDIVTTMLHEQITGVHAVPSFWRMMLQRHSPLSTHQYPHLRYVSVIGESFIHEDIVRLKQIFQNTEFYMMYGTTEAFRSTCLLPDQFDRKFPSVGKPLPGVELSILNADGLPCKAYEIGEIVHRGVFISPGYWNLSELSATTFKGQALFTGDLGWLDDEGFLYYSERKDALLKIMGIRISPGEIEDCLRKLPGVREAVIVGVNQNQVCSIKAVIVREEDSVLTAEEVLRYCKSQLPHYMVPHHVEFRAELPRTATLKINRSQLGTSEGGLLV